ncbi:MAG: stage V sporulation protein AB [Clostridia bacterium]|nr:stage V sporulation protein AB [Clostridia bacterium]
MIDALTILIALLSGAAAAIAASCVWGVLLIPARVQDRLQAGSPYSLTWAICLGLMLSACHDMLGFTLHLPEVFGILGLLLGGMFVGMLAAALEEILEVAPVFMRRFRLGNVSTGVRFVMMLGKGLGAILAALVFTF